MSLLISQNIVLNPYDFARLIFSLREDGQNPDYNLLLVMIHHIEEWGIETVVRPSVKESDIDALSEPVENRKKRYLQGIEEAQHFVPNLTSKGIGVTLNWLLSSNQTSVFYKFLLEVAYLEDTQLKIDRNNFIDLLSKRLLKSGASFLENNYIDGLTHLGTPISARTFNGAWESFMASELSRDFS